MRMRRREVHVPTTSRSGLPAGRIVTYMLLGMWAMFCAFPLYWLAVASIKPVTELSGQPHYIPFVDFLPSLDAWRFISPIPRRPCCPASSTPS